MSKRSKRIRKALAASDVKQDGPLTWFVLQLASGEKWSIPDHGLEWSVRQAALRLGYEAWYPWYITDVIDGRILSRPTALSHLPGYVFVRVAPWQSTGVLRKIAGVADVVRFGELPEPVPDEVISIVRQTFAGHDDKPFEVEAEEYEVGDIAPVIQGIWANFDAEVKALAKKDKIEVWLNIFGRVVGVSLPVQHLGPVKHRSHAPQRAA